MAGSTFDLRAWLRRNPKPRKIRLTIADEERVIDLISGKTQWAEVESTVRNFRPSLVECLTEKLEVIRTCRLEEDEADNPPDARERSEARSHQANASMLDAYGRRMNEAFAAGASAASVSQENLVAIVETLSSHLSLAITNLHTLSVNMANLVSQQGDSSGGEGKSDQMLGLLTAMLGAKGLPSAPVPPNGGKKSP